MIYIASLLSFAFGSFVSYFLCYDTLKAEKERIVNLRNQVAELTYQLNAARQKEESSVEEEPKEGNCGQGARTTSSTKKKWRRKA